MEEVHDTGNSPPPPFLSKTYDMVDDLSTDSVVSWSKSNNSFVVWNVPEFSKVILPKYFKHSNFSSFVRQLNTYGYRKVDPDCWEFANEGFLRGHKHLLKTIIRRKPSQMQVHQEPASQVQSAPVAARVEVGKFGIEEEVERLKRDKIVHMDELVKLQQEQQATDHHLENVGQRLQLMEQRQQQTMSFLAKALQSPGFIAQLVHQQNEGNRRINGMNKKRRRPNQEKENYAGDISTLHDRQIVRYQPLINEAAIALLQKILKTNASGRPEAKVKNTNGFLTNHAHLCGNTLDSGGTSSRISGVTLSELPTSSQSHLMSDSGYPFNSQSSAIPEIQYYPSVVPGEAKVSQFPELNALNFQTDHVLPDFSEGNGIDRLGTSGITELKQRSETGDVPYVDTVQRIVDGVASVVPGAFSIDTDVDLILDEMPMLPGISDTFWDHILSASPLTGDKHGIGSLALEEGLAKEEDVLRVQESDCNRMNHMSHLTEQMGLLASSSHSG